MTAILYPVAETAEAALHAPRGYAEREQAARLLGGAVRFVTEVTGPAFATREAALDAYAGCVEDERPERPVLAPELRWRQLAPVSSADGRPTTQALERPSFRNGRRWPTPKPVATLWRLAVSYWRIEDTRSLPEGPARRMRRTDAGRDLDAAALTALSRQPMQAMRPQQPLDIGLFEVRLPEAPDTVMPDE